MCSITKDVPIPYPTLLWSPPQHNMYLVDKTCNQGNYFPLAIGLFNKRVTNETPSFPNQSQ